MVVTLFLPASRAAPGEAGELVYFTEYGPRPPSPDPVIAAAGDIACPAGEPATATSCHQQATSDLLVGIALTGVLALGDLQYEQGRHTNFRRSYDRGWGRLKAITHPVPGNHEYQSGAGGYFLYFGPAAGDPTKGYYSFDIGQWRLIARRYCGAKPRRSVTACAACTGRPPACSRPARSRTATTRQLPGSATACPS